MPDVGESRQAAASAARAARLMADAMPQLVWSCRPDGECDLLSRRWVEYTGIPEAAQVGLGWLEPVHAEEREATLSAWRAGAAGGRPFDVQLRLRRHDGCYRRFHAVALPRPDPDASEGPRWIGSADDVDDRLREERVRARLLEEARRHAAEVEAILAAHADALVIYGPDGEIRMTNPAARELFGAPDGAAGYRQVTLGLAPVDARGEPLDVERLPSRRAMRGEAVRGELVGVHVRGRLTWYSSSATPLRSAEGVVMGAVLSLVDVTHVRRLQEERELMIRALTHDARTRLNVIQSHGELLGRAGTEDARRRGGIIVTSSRRLAETIDALVVGGSPA